jgi:hypothetical protein
MEIEKLISALEETITYLRKSDSSGWSNMSSAEIIRKLEAEVVKAQNRKPVDVYTLERLFAPTGVIQEASIENGWGTRFLCIAEVVDECIGG